MKLNVFNFIEEVIDKVDYSRDDIGSRGEEIRDYFNHILSNQPSLYDINLRVKSDKSIREKILRQNYFLKYKTVENVLDHMSDIIGIRVQCRFIEDEKKIFEIISHYFALECTDYEGYFYNPRNERIILKLLDKQPQVQNNGFIIYRIDGKYLGDETRYNFELQIKSFVNVFWGDIEHEILYKNFSYMITEDFVREMLYSIKRSLEQVDAQLMAVHEYLNGLETNPDDANIRQMKKVVSKMIHDLFAIGFKESTGVLLDFRASADLIVDYLFAKERYRQADLSEYFTDIIKRLANFNHSEFDFGGYLSIDDTSTLVYKPCRKLGSGIESIINADLKWNLILSIVFELSDQSKEEEFSNFVDYLIFMLTHAIDCGLGQYRIDEPVKEAIRNKLIDMTVDLVCDHYDSDLFSMANMTMVEKNVVGLLALNNEDSKSIKSEDLDYSWFDKRIRKEAEF